MELNIKPFHKNNFPLGAVLVKNPSVAEWILEIQRMQLVMNEIRVFPIPGIVANSIWGCLIIPNQVDAKFISALQIVKNEFCQRVSKHLFIAEKSILHPTSTPAEIENLFTEIAVMHPEFGLAELTEEWDLQKLLSTPVLRSVLITKPKNPVFIPRQIRSFQVKPIPPEEVLRNLEENAFPKREAMEKDKPLTTVEKLKLKLYKKLFERRKNKDGEVIIEKTNFLTEVESLFGFLQVKGNTWPDKLQQDYEDLEKRNQEEIEKLLDLLRNNPEEALKYAIPLDTEGSSRGESDGRLNLSLRWSDLSLTNSTLNSGSGGSVNLSDHFYTLQMQYNTTAEALIAKKDYKKAAFVYMKLLKNHYKAAETMENGKYFQEAATIYLKHVDNKNKAAECYEKGNMIEDAIELYKELDANEKVGDLYIGINKRKEAMVYFEKVVENYKSSNQYVKASLIYKKKMQNESGGQQLLLQGWRENRDAVNCLNYYFEGIHDLKSLNREINDIYSGDVTDVNSEQFLQVIRFEYDKKNELADPIREMAYEIIAARIPSNPSIVSELKSFNKEDRELVRDTIRFKVGKKK